MLLITLKIIHVAVCFFLILVVLLQQGKGADLSVFGGGSTMSAFGARGAASVFHKLTVVGFVLFTVTTLSISLVGSRNINATVMDEVPAVEETTETAPETAEPAAATETAPEGQATPAETPDEPPAAEAETSEGEG